MSLLVCPRCRRTNPEIASFCYFDGAELRSRQDGAFHRLGREFVFPSGSRCRTMDEFARGCRDEWPAARDLLREGVFKQYFGGIGRTDVAKFAQEAMARTDADIGLTTFLDALPLTESRAPKIDINPRRLLLGNLLAGEQRQLQITVTNQGEGSLQGTMTVKEGGAWLKIDGPDVAHCAIATGAGARREQKIALRVDTRSLPAGGTFGAKLTVITNGGAVEVVARMELVAQPFTQTPFQGAKTPREMAERMRKLPKAAVPILEDGEVARWFASNGWNFPVRGPQAKGVAGVQQFFETMGLSKPPDVQIAPTAVRLACAYPGAARSQVLLQTPAKKWVYAAVTSDSPWLRVLTPQVGGPQQATIAFEVDSRAAIGSPAQGNLQVMTNGGKMLTLPVSADVSGLPKTRRQKPVTADSTRPDEPARLSDKPAPVAGVPRHEAAPASDGPFRPTLAVALAFLIIRLLLVPVVDLQARSAAVAQAAAKLGAAPGVDSPLSSFGGWLRLPWLHVLAGADKGIPAGDFQPGQSGSISAREFRHYFGGYLLRWLVLWTAWLGALIGAVIVVRGSSPANAAWGIVAGMVAGVAVSVTLGSVFLVIEIVPHAVWGLLFPGQGAGLGLWLLWVVLALACWTICGAVLGFCLSFVPPCRRLLVAPAQRAVVELCRFFGLRGLAHACGGSR